MKPWEIETTISDINPEIETATSAQLTILNMAIKPLIRTSAFEVSLIFNIELPVVEATNTVTSIMNRSEGYMDLLEK